MTLIIFELSFEVERDGSSYSLRLLQRTDVKERVNYPEDHDKFVVDAKVFGTT